MSNRRWPWSCALLQTVPGKILALVIRYEMHDVRRFGSVQQFVSYCRLVKCRESAGKKAGGRGSKIGNAHLKWAFSEAAVLKMRDVSAARKYVARMGHKHDKAKASAILPARLRRTVYWMLKRKAAFDETLF